MSGKMKQNEPEVASGSVIDVGEAWQRVQQLQAGWQTRVLASIVHGKAGETRQQKMKDYRQDALRCVFD